MRKFMVVILASVPGFDVPGGDGAIGGHLCSAGCVGERRSGEGRGPHPWETTHTRGWPPATPSMPRKSNRRTEQHASEHSSPYCVCIAGDTKKWKSIEMR